ncbi:MAG TPA: DUF5709 domain-containing protein [Coriobacteriia bacterium]|nr:DUF5709 domain-containing protein [Coriobacteriia bacterium]
MSDIDSDFLAKHTYLSDGRPESLDERLAREVPDYVDPEVPYERQPDAIGALVSEPDEGPEDEPDEEQDVLARAEGPARADVGAEEAAMHLIDEDEPYVEEEDYSEFSSDVEDEGDEDADDEVVDRDDDSGEFVFDADSGEFVFDTEEDEG